MSELKIENYIDERNLSLWNDLKMKYTILLERSFEPNFLCYTQGRDAIIYIPVGSLCKDSFTHELLHIYIKSKNIRIGEYLTQQYRRDPILSGVFSTALFEHIINCLEHIKMLPIYLNLGFSRVKFIKDYKAPKCKPKDIDLLKNGWHSSGIQKRLVADYYVGKFFAIKACPNDSIDYSKFLNSLQSIDNDLFAILTTFWQSWQEYDIDKSFSYYGFSDLFITNLKQWVVSTGIAK